MRAVLAALSVLLFPVLVAPATPVAAQCTAAEAGARPGVLTARPPPAGGEAHPAPSWPASSWSASSWSEAGMLGVTPPRMAMRSDAIAAQMPSPLVARSAPYQPYQSHPVHGAPLTSEEVAPSLRARGFVDVSAVRQRGRSFLAEATGPRGERVRLVLDAESGEISGMQVIGFHTAP